MYVYVYDEISDSPWYAVHCDECGFDSGHDLGELYSQEYLISRWDDLVIDFTCIPA